MKLKTNFLLLGSLGAIILPTTIVVACSYVHEEERKPKVGSKLPTPQGNSDPNYDEEGVHNKSASNQGDTNKPVSSHPGDTNEPASNPGDTNEPASNPGDTNEPVSHPGGANKEKIGTDKSSKALEQPIKNPNINEYALFENYKTSSEIQEDEPKIVEYGVPSNSNNKKIDFFLGENGMELLKDKIVKHIGYGPEMFMLDSIVIGDPDIITEEANGMYVPSTNQIIINANNLKDILGSDAYNDAYLETKVQMVFEIIFHEYGHHIAYVYLNSLKSSDSNNTKSVTNETTSTTNPLKVFSHNGNTWQEQSWNKHFVKWFKKLLNYDKETPKTQRVRKLPPSVNFSHYFHFFERIAKQFNQKDLFEISNGQSNRKYDDFQNWFSQQNHDIQMDFSHNGVFPNLYYYYSLDELFTRKYQQLNQIIYSQPSNENTFFRDDGLIDTPNGNQGEIFPADVAFNTFWYQDDFDIFMQTSTNTPGTERYQFDAPFDNELFNRKDNNGNSIKSYPQDLYNLMDAHLGHVSTFNFSENTPSINKQFTYLQDNETKDGADISFVWRPNHSKIEGDSKDGSRWISNFQQNVKNDNLIKFGGYINVDPNSNNPIVGVQFGNSSTFEPIFVTNYTYKHKAELATNTTLPLANDVEKYFYTTQNWVDSSQIANQKISFVYKNGTTTPLKTIRQGDYGTPSTYAPYLLLNGSKYLEEQQNTFTEIIAKKNTKNEVVIGSG